jgi:hypothetical protein
LQPAAAIASAARVFAPGPAPLFARLLYCGEG